MAKVNTFAKSERVLSMYVCMGGSRNKIGWQNCSESQMYTLHKTYHQIIQWDDGTTERSANIRTDQLLTHLTTFVCRYVSRILYTYWQTYAQIYTHTHIQIFYIYIHIYTRNIDLFGCNALRCTCTSPLNAPLLGGGWKLRTLLQKNIKKSLTRFINFYFITEFIVTSSSSDFILNYYYKN